MPVAEAPNAVGDHCLSAIEKGKQLYILRNPMYFSQAIG